jgi:amino acid adenylation domain-containing protein/non-ribosomal peptide synthase protein (TIGR01720 family)
LAGTVEYATDLFDAATIDRLTACFERLLAAALAAPERRVFELPLLGEAERQQLLTEWNDTAVPLPQGALLYSLFAAQVMHAPDALAATFAGESLTYRELAARAERLAGHLRRLGCGPESRVGVALERTLDLLAAFLGVLEAGAVYVPLDPEYPRERLAYLLEDSRPAALITQESLRGRLPLPASLPVLIPAALPEADGRLAPEGRQSLGDDLLAYVIYTSGSTGRPKGAMVTHGGMINHLRAKIADLGLEPHSRVAQTASPCFDISVWQLLAPLLAGGSVHIAGEASVHDPELLLGFAAEERITVLEVVPSLLSGMLEPLAAAGGAFDLSSLRWMIVTGEACAPDLADRWLALAPHTRLLNAYGPTECSDDVTHFERVQPGFGPALSLPIGRPVVNTRIYVLDSAGGPSAQGVPGELCVAGRGVGRGYLGLPARTAQVFVPDAWSGETGSRLYRTGDLARWRADGTLEYLGRLDHQVKVRGFRIELGEIEAALSALPGVREAAVMVRDQRLVAYVAGDASAGVLREALRERLPDYMVPAVFVALAALPLTANGKVDRKALLAQDAAPSAANDPSGAASGYAAPRTREEEILAAVWAQVLRLPRVGVDDNFFELGGDSILSVQIVARARQAGLRFTVRQIFEHQTVAALARHATLTETAGASPAGRGPVAGEVPLTPIQRWFFAQGFADPHHFNQALLLESREPLDPAALERAMAALVEHHDALRMRFDFAGGDWRQENAPAEPLASRPPFHQVDLSGLPASLRDKACEQAAADLQAGFDLSAGPLTRLCLFDACRLLWVTHHLVVDGVSWRVLLEDLERAYRRAGLPPKTTSFQEWARRLSAQAGSEALAREVDYWRETARAPVPRLPVDFPSGGNFANRVGDEATVSFELSAEETTGLLQTLPAVYHSRIDDALLSALVRALADWTGSPRLRVDLEGHGREPLSGDIGDIGGAGDLDVSRTVGWFTSLYPVVLEAGDADPGAALVSAKERMRAVPGRGIGYGLLRDLGDTLLAAAPAAEILFNYLGQVDATSNESSLFRASTTGTGPSRSPRAHRTHLLEIGGIVAGGRLRITLTYGSRTHRRETAERLAAAYAGALRELVRQGRDSEEVFTPSDFPKAGLDVHSFQQLASLLPDLKTVEDLYPLSPVQSGMLFHSLMAPESGVYVNQVTCTLPADLDRGLFRQAWERLVERHGVLRTAFLWDGLDAPLQVVRESCALPWQEVDWRGLPAAEQQRRLAELRHSERHAPLPLTRAPLMRFSLIRLDGELRFIWTYHHLLMDGWSLPLLVRELGSVYAALREGGETRPTALPPARPFSDYVVWLQDQEPAKAEPFWRGELAGFTVPNPLGILGTDHPAGTDGVSSYAEHGLRVSRAVTAALQALAARHKLTLQTVTLGAWAVLVSRYSREEDVVFGNVVSGRPAALPGVETMIGMFINTLPVRARVNDAEPLASWLRRLQERQLARQDFEHTPLAQIQRWSEVPAGSPLFETLYVFENYPDVGDGTGGSSSLGIGDLRLLESTNYPLTLTLTAADQISLRLTSDGARVGEDAAARLLQHFATLLAGMAAGRGESSERRVGDLGLLSPAERHQAIAEWNDTGVAPAGERLLLDLLAARAAQAPDLPAVVQGGEQLSHGELAARSDRLAAHLRVLGAGPDVLVGLFLERSADLVVALLAVLKAGGAYLPLDLSLPRPRLSFLLADARPPLVLTRTRLLPDLPECSSCAVCLDDLPEDAPEIAAAVPAVRPAADNLAYVLYTSGSTGHPKGVAVTHRGLANYLLWAAEAYPAGEAGENRGAPVHSPLSFDLTVTSLFLPLLAGRCVHLVPEEEGVEGLAAALAEGGFGLVKLTPAHLEVLQRLLPPERAAGCAGAFVIGGEALTGEQLAFWREHAPGLRLINEYGPTETVVGCCTYELPASMPPAGPVPIGRPIANTRILLLDRGLHPVPVGVPGELYLGGAGVCRGYLHRPGLTAEKLVPDPFGAAGERLYRTGDLARRLPDGAIEFLGRTDDQVKIRGFRIELGEIEAALLALPGIQQAVVVVRESRLVAYVAGDVLADELRRSLRERLPDSMMPAAFVTLAALPLTANGKVDRKALSARDAAPDDRPGARDGYVAPRSREEEILATVWAQVLRLPRVGVDDNFFELGGDSILSVQIVARARQAGLLVTLRQIFAHPTVAGLARYATATETGAAAAGQGPVVGEVPLTPIQRWFFEHGFADPHHFNQALLLEPREPLAPAALERAMAALVEHHDALRMRFEVDPQGGEDGWRQENAPAEPLAPLAPTPPFHQVDLSGLPAPRLSEAFERAAAALQAGFDLSAGPLTRLCLFKAKPERLLWVAHHLVVDGVSWRVLVEDLEGAYRQAARGLRSSLPPKTTSFQEWARRLATHAGSAALARELEHWRETARVPVRRLPVDFPSGGTSEAGDLVGDEATVSFELSAAETTGLLQTLPAVYHSRIDDALLSALVRALAGWTGSPRVRVDLEGHGREPLSGDIGDDLDLSRTVGWFTSLYPVVLEAGDADPGAALVSVKERLRAVPGRGIGYGLLRHLGDTLLEAAPAAEILFNYLGQADTPSDGLSLFRVSTAGIGPCRSPRGHRTHPLEIVGLVTEGRLRITLTYGSRTYRRETVERLAAAYAGALRQLLQHSRESEEVFTPSDFSKARLDTRSFAKVAALLADSD